MFTEIGSILKRYNRYVYQLWWNIYMSYAAVQKMDLIRTDNVHQALFMTRAV